MKILEEIHHHYHLNPADTIMLKWDDEEVLRHTATEEMDFNGGIIFELEEGDIPRVKSGIGGAFIEREGW